MGDETHAADAFDVSGLYYDILRPGGADTSLATSLVSPGEIVLDIGAGTGANSIALAALPARVYAMEPNRAMRTAFLSRLSLRRDLLPSVTLLPLAAEGNWSELEAALPAPRTVDVGLMLGVIHMFDRSHRRQALQNLHVRLRSGGLLAIDGASEDESLGEVDVPLGTTSYGGLVVEGRLRTARTLTGQVTRVDYTTRLGATELWTESVEYQSWPCTTGELTDDLSESGFELLHHHGSVLKEWSSAQPGLVVAQAVH